MCSCGRKAPTQVMTSAQAEELAAARAAQEAENAAIVAAANALSARNAVGNANSGWHVASEASA
jgi:hypothetical protein